MYKATLFVRQLFHPHLRVYKMAINYQLTCTLSMLENSLQAMLLPLRFKVYTVIYFTHIGICLIITT